MEKNAPDDAKDFFHVVKRCFCMQLFINA